MQFLFKTHFYENLDTETAHYLLSMIIEFAGQCVLNQPDIVRELWLLFTRHQTVSRYILILTQIALV